MHNCPPEVLETIFTFLDIDSLRVCLQVCEKWINILNNSFLVLKLWLSLLAKNESPRVEREIRQLVGGRKLSIDLTREVINQMEAKLNRLDSNILDNKYHSVERELETNGWQLFESGSIDTDFENGVLSILTEQFTRAAVFSLTDMTELAKTSPMRLPILSIRISSNLLALFANCAAVYILDWKTGVSLATLRADFELSVTHLKNRKLITVSGNKKEKLKIWKLSGELNSESPLEVEAQGIKSEVVMDLKLKRRSGFQWRDLSHLGNKVVGLQSRSSPRVLKSLHMICLETGREFLSVSLDPSETYEIKGRWLFRIGRLSKKETGLADMKKDYLHFGDVEREHPMYFCNGGQKLITTSGRVCVNQRSGQPEKERTMDRILTFGCDFIGIQTDDFTFVGFVPNSRMLQIRDYFY